MLSVSRPYIINDRMIDEYGRDGGMRICKGNRSTLRKPVPVPLYPPKIPHDLAWYQTWSATCLFITFLLF